MKDAVRSHRLATVFVAALVVLVAGGIAYATIPTGSGVINGCYDTKTGALRVIDPDVASDTCTAKEKSLSWSQTGPQGPAGTADAYARVAPNGTVNAQFSKGITSANVTHPATGVYCIRDLPFTPSIAVGNGGATIAIDAGSGEVSATNFDTVVTTATLPLNPDAFLGLCDTDVGPHAATVRIYVYGSQAAALVDRAFSILLDD